MSLFNECNHIYKNPQIYIYTYIYLGSVGKESACNAGEPGSVPGSGRCTRDGIGYPLQYSWASLVAQLVKNPPANAREPGDMGSIPGLGRSDRKSVV